MKLLSACLLFASVYQCIDESHAQLPVTATWQISADGGTTWAGGETIIPLEIQSVQVRLLVGWDPSNLIYPPTNWYADCRFDGVVESVSGAGVGDTIDHVSLLNLNQWQDFSTTIIGHRQDNILKVDTYLDTLPPGQGAGIGPNQNPTSPVHPALLDNPIRIFQYELLLDGSLGQRNIFGAWLAGPTGEPVNFRVWEGIQQPVWATSLVNVPASVTVVPSPCALLAVGCAAAGVARRRR